MKKNMIILVFAAILFSCNSTSEGSKTVVSKSPADNPDYQKGLNLVAKSDCFTCHKISGVLIGPAYNLIGGKYANTEANINLLSEKIQKGGSGVWGQVPMAAHTNLSKEDAVAMVKYILLLKDEK